MQNRSLANLLSDNLKAMELEWSKRLNVVKGLANALSYLHHECTPAIIDRDISSNNVLMEAQYEAHVADFGSASILVHESSSKWSSFARTLGCSVQVSFPFRFNPSC